MRNKPSVSYRSEIIAYAEKQYGTTPEYLWQSIPGYAVLRHGDSRKWYGLIMDVPAEKLGMSGKNVVDIIEIKCDPILSGSLTGGKGIRPAYHMKQGKELLSGRQEWIVPVNPKYYDLQKAFSENEEIIWKQSSNISVGDVIFLYVTAPVSAVLYRCEATEVNIPYHYDDGNVHMDHVMRLRKLEQYEPSFLPFEKLKTYGIGTIRGPRRMPHSLICELERNRHEQ